MTGLQNLFFQPSPSSWFEKLQPDSPPDLKNLQLSATLLSNTDRYHQGLLFFSVPGRRMCAFLVVPMGFV
ncbi:hypothetical protein PGT21_009560 [Puccinia graminis f. sp. tritici]|uniref:Uncharacterized protein n=1 Tax=Puccinia graminis f. sp. tritici TaxID=56615 RepID=A0A5B0P7T2_PUCGR|nr:hypothetical protein PGT21_009560 [Puccinia graminis f. sp. tritici]